ncbi:hypothetical protein HDU93_005644, partial [Gonapodya sp. JEL0774]
MALAGSLFTTLSRGGGNSLLSGITFAPMLVFFAGIYFIPSEGIVAWATDPKTDVRWLYAIAIGLLAVVFLLSSFVFSRLPLFYPEVEVGFAHQVVVDVIIDVDLDTEDGADDDRGRGRRQNVDWSTVTEQEFRKMAPDVDCLRAEVWETKDGQ